MTDQELRKLDYEKTLEYTAQLTETRFRLLALLPVATGAALSFADTKEHPMTGLFLGLMGFFVTIGIVIYDQRNSQIYGKAMRRARILELRLGIPPTYGDAGGGVVGGRPIGPKRKLFGLFEMWHDCGLSLIYSSVLGVWTYLITATSFVLAAGHRRDSQILALLLIPLAVAIVFFIELIRHDEKDEETKTLEREIDSLMESKDIQSEVVLPPD